MLFRRYNGYRKCANKRPEVLGEEFNGEGRLLENGRLLKHLRYVWIMNRFCLNKFKLQ